MAELAPLEGQRAASGVRGTDHGLEPPPPAWQLEAQSPVPRTVQGMVTTAFLALALSVACPIPAGRGSWCHGGRGHWMQARIKPHSGLTWPQLSPLAQEVWQCWIRSELAGPSGGALQLRSVNSSEHTGKPSPPPPTTILRTERAPNSARAPQHWKSWLCSRCFIIPAGQPILFRAPDERLRNVFVI